jgi:hypothetical protein
MCEMDFCLSNRSLAGIRDEFNRKGLISDQEQKKIAFYVFEKAYIDKIAREAGWLREGLAISGETYGPTSFLLQISSRKDAGLMP